MCGVTSVTLALILGALAAGVPRVEAQDCEAGGEDGECALSLMQKSAMLTTAAHRGQEQARPTPALMEKQGARQDWWGWHDPEEHEEQEEQEERDPEEQEGRDPEEHEEHEEQDWWGWHDPEEHEEQEEQEERDPEEQEGRDPEGRDPEEHETPAPAPAPVTPAPPSPSPGPSDSNYKPLSWIPKLSSPFPIQACAQIRDDSGAPLDQRVQTALASEGKTQCIQAFGALIAGTAGANSNAMRYSANIIAQLLDPNCDGTPDDPKVAAKLNKFQLPDAPFINYGTDQSSEESRSMPAESFSSQVWKAEEDTEKPGICLEEAFHMVHQKAWAEVYPDKLGYKKWGDAQQSVACRCMREAQCVWYQHPENSGCTGIDGRKCSNPKVDLLSVGSTLRQQAIPGTCSTGGCSDPSCDCLEFFHKVFTTWLGNKYMGYETMGAKINELKGQGLTQREAIEKLLSQSAQCSQLLAYMKDPMVALPKHHINETYECQVESVSK